MDNHHFTSASTGLQNINTVPLGNDPQLVVMENTQRARMIATPLGTVLIAVAIASVPWQAAVAQIRRGQSGAEVNYIQSCLRKLGYFKGNITGNFGPKTENAVRSFQQAKGINAIGVVGPQTQRALNRRCRRTSSRARTQPRSRSSNQLTVGSSGDAVIQLQQNLQRLGFYRGVITGNFQDMTVAAVKEFQQARGLVPDGVVGNRTQREIRISLNNINSQTNPSSNQLTVGSSGDAVIQLQQNLQRLGFYRGVITGNFQDTTVAAVKEFQQSRGLVPDGIVGSRTQREITISLNDINIQPQPQLPSPQNPGRVDPFPNALNQGDVGSRVVELQRALRELRYLTVNPTGVFGNLTRDAIARFQQDNGLIANGIADSQTIAAMSQALDRLFSTCTPARGDMCVGENSQRVTAVQKRLQERGLFPGNPTGYYDQVTSAAVAQFQRSSGLNPTGFVDTRTFQALGLGNNSQNRYVVVVPLRDDDTLDKVRQLVPQAFKAESPLGAYVNAGNFRDRSDAEKRTRMLRSQGIDARVTYF
ncbi:MAG: peptidoglycan-binding protein [Calothrix sp. MO_192.B10]|nr:peptidoglycan-binding protein [Calothrix sp. MO_192.B10]